MRRKPQEESNLTIPPWFPIHVLSFSGSIKPVSCGFHVYVYLPILTVYCSWRLYLCNLQLLALPSCIMCVCVLFLVMSPDDAELMLAELYLFLLTQKDGWMKVVSNGKSCCLTECREWWFLFEFCSFIAIQIVSNFHTLLWESFVLKRYNEK